jgi:hypothetical protein
VPSKNLARTPDCKGPLIPCDRRRNASLVTPQPLHILVLLQGNCIFFYLLACWHVPPALCILYLFFYTATFLGLLFGKLFVCICNTWIFEPLVFLKSVYDNAIIRFSVVASFILFFLLKINIYAWYCKLKSVPPFLRVTQC